MRYSIVAVSLLPPALGLPHLSWLLGGGSGDAAVRHEHQAHTLGQWFGDVEHSGTENSPAYGGGYSEGGESLPLNNSPVPESTFSAPDYTPAPALSSRSEAYTTSVYVSSSSLPSSTAVSGASSGDYSGSGPSSNTPKTCESPDIVGCPTTQRSPASLVAPDSIGVFDFIIVGGGTAGLVIANRLSEDSEVKVAVIEAGDLVFDNKNVTDVDGYGLSFGTEIDWQYQSSPQIFAGGKNQTLRAGKALGGTSTINGMAYLRAQAAQIDAWEALGNKGWNWKSLLPFYKRSEHFQIPTKEQIQAGLGYELDVHGRKGPLKTGWNTGLLGKDVTSLINETYCSVGLPYLEEANGGSMRGFTRYAATVDRELNIREDAARAYYKPIQNRTNLEIFTNSFVQRITWQEGVQTFIPRANGVVFTDKSGAMKTITAEKEVILSAGSLRSPLLLELSGIGNPDILKKHGIEVKVNLPTVGENLQDQITGAGSYTTNKTFSGTANYVGYFSASDIFGDSTSNLNCSFRESISSYATTVVNASSNILDLNVTETLFRIQHDLIFNTDIPISEIILSPGENSIQFSYWGLLPFSRGSVHITSNDSSAPAAINPNYFMLDYDLQQQIGTAKAVRKLGNADVLKDIVIGESMPGLDAVPEDASDEQWAKALKSSYRSNYHYISTAAMMSKEMGGVVDPNLLVYGTDNIRVIDASVIPFQVCGHLTATIYAIAEKAAVAIKDRYY